MDRPTLFVIELLSLIVVALAGNGNVSTQNSHNAVAESTTGQHNQGRLSSSVPARPLCACVQTCPVIREIMHSCGKQQVLHAKA